MGIWKEGIVVRSIALTHVIRPFLSCGTHARIPIVDLHHLVARVVLGRRVVIQNPVECRIIGIVADHRRTILRGPGGYQDIRAGVGGRGQEQQERQQEGGRDDFHILFESSGSSCILRDHGAIVSIETKGINYYPFTLHIVELRDERLKEQSNWSYWLCKL